MSVTQEVVFDSTKILILKQFTTYMMLGQVNSGCV